MANVYVLGPEPFNFGLLESVPGAEDLRLLELLGVNEAVDVGPGFSFDELVERADARIRQNGAPDAIVNYWDFPGSCVTPVVCRMNGLPTPRLEAVATFEHKYWARREMAAAIPEVTPRFCAIDPFAEDPLQQLEIGYPFWLKPVIGHSSYLGFRVDSEAEFHKVLAVTRGKIRHCGDPFDEFLKHVEVPPEIRGVGGTCCIAEEIISAEHQVTLEGFMHDGEVFTVGWIDSLREGQVASCFSHYAYPSQLPDTVLERMKRHAAAVLNHAGYDNAPFNVEFFWDAETDRISLLEVNTRISKSHGPLFLLVDGASHQKVSLDLALGQRPEFPPRRGDWPFAAKFMVRLFQDGEVTRVPNSAELHLVQSRYPEAMVQVLVDGGQRLSHLAFQDSYSFEIADIFLGGGDDGEVRRKYSDVMETLPFEIDLTAPLPEDS